MTRPVAHTAFVAAWKNRRGEMVPVTWTISRTAREARAKAAKFWDAGWFYAAKKEGWRIVKINFQMPYEAKP